ncbi:aspartate kinase [Chloroflexota bacterium]
MIVHKFGGTSLGNAQRFECVAKILEHANQGKVLPVDNIAVVSAMSGVTNELISGALAAAQQNDLSYRQIKAGLLERHLEVLSALIENKQERLQVGGFIEDNLHELGLLYRSIALLGELTARGRDRVTSFGEILSAKILAALLRQGGVRSQAVSATELIVTDKNFGAARPLMDLTRERAKARLEPLLLSGVLPIVTGYIAASEGGMPTTLGRGGSDYSAAILGACLAVDEVWIWSDVDGILTADPNLVPDARTLEELTYQEAAELAFYGADVLHPKTIRPLVEEGIPLRLLNSFNPDHPGTRIISQPSNRRELLPAIISTTGLTAISISKNGNGGDWSLARTSTVLDSLSQAGIEVPMLSQSFSEQSLNLILRQQDQAHCLSALNNGLGDRHNIQVKERVSTVSVVGAPNWNGKGILSHTFSALGKLGVRVISIAQAASEHSVSICIPENDTAEVVRFLHHEMGLDTQFPH